MSEAERGALSNRRASGLRFGSKLIMLLLAVVLSVQLATLLAVKLAVEGAVDAQLHRELDVGQRVWHEAQASRLRQLFDRVSELADDPALSAAISSGDQALIDSALGTAGSRIGASYALLMSPAGELLTALLPGQTQLDVTSLRRLLEEGRAQGYVAGVASAGGESIAISLAPVFAPELVAWVGIGLPFGEQAMNQFRDTTGLDAVLLIGADCRVAVGAGRLVDWQPSAAICARLTRAGQGVEVTINSTEAGEPMRAARLSKYGSEPVFLLFKSSRDRALQPFLSLGQQVMGLAALATVLALLVAVGVGRQVSRPLARVGAAAARIVRGDYSTPLVVRGSDEIAELADAFNRMQEGISRREQQIVYQSGHDALTRLPNRERALLSLGEILADGAAEDVSGAVLLVDIRGFRQINDLFGHGFGDQVLVKVAERLQSAVRSGDVVARLGGNEFLVLLLGVESEFAQAHAQRLAQTLKQPLALEGSNLQLEVHIGLALFPESGADGQALVRRADIALNEAKRSGAVVTAYTPGRDEQHLRQLRLIGDLREAIDGAELSLVFQPKVDMGSDEVCHAEALVRWKHPQLGSIPPDEFIPLAERAGLIRNVSTFVIEHSIAQVAAWQSRGLQSGVAINLSALDLGDVQVVGQIAALLKQHRVAPAQLIIEVTESAVMQDLGVALETLGRLQRLGVRLAIDDFGTGQSSLAQLKRMPVDELKIDQSFVMSLLPGSEDEQIVRSIIELAHALSMKVVAEGVETEVALELLKKHGCETAQGFFFSKPLSADDYLKWCGDRSGSRLALS